MLRRHVRKRKAHRGWASSHAFAGASMPPMSAKEKPGSGRAEFALMNTVNVPRFGQRVKRR